MVRLPHIACFSILLFILVSASCLSAQEAVPVTNRSTTVHYIDGTPYYLHAVLQGQTLYSISRAYGVSQEDIVGANPDIRDGLRFDMIIRIPLPTLQIEAGDDNHRIYRVSPGETKYGISRMVGLTVAELEALNPDIVEGLRSGMEIRLPVERAVNATEIKEQLQPPIVAPPAALQRPTRISDTICPETPSGRAYQVALLIPLYLESLDSPDDTFTSRDGIDGQGLLDSLVMEAPGRDAGFIRRGTTLPLDHKSFSFISYYHGVLLALDSIQKAGADITLHVYDVCQELPKAWRATNEPGFRDMDLIIGPFHRQTLDYVAAFGQRNNIPVVSPLLPDNQQLQGVSNLLKAMPSLETMLEGVAHYIAGTYPRQNIILVHNNQPGAAPIISAFKDELFDQVALMNHLYDSLNLARINGYYFNGTLVGNRRTNVLIMPDTLYGGVIYQNRPFETSRQPASRPSNVKEVIYSQVGMEGLQKQLVTDRQNVLITLISGEPFLSDYLRQLHLHRHDYPVSIFGIPEWQDYASIEIDYLQNLGVHIFTPYFFDYSDDHMREFVARYRRNFLTEPDRDAFMGANTAYFFFDALHSYGPDFASCMYFLNQKGYESPFLFERPFGESGGWENQRSFIYRINDYRRVEVTRPQTSEGERE